MKNNTNLQPLLQRKVSSNPAHRRCVFVTPRHTLANWLSPIGEGAMDLLGSLDSHLLMGDGGSGDSEKG